MNVPHTMTLSTDPSKFDETAYPPSSLSPEEAAMRLPVRPSMFDACHVGVVLRAVLFVQAVIGVGAMFGTDALLDWLLRFSLFADRIPKSGTYFRDAPGTFRESALFVHLFRNNTACREGSVHLARYSPHFCY